MLDRDDVEVDEDDDDGGTSTMDGEEQTWPFYSASNSLTLLWQCRNLSNLLATRGSPRISRRRRRIKRRGSELHVNANETRGESIYGMNLHANIVIRSIRSCATICFRVVVLRGWRAKRRKNVCTDFVKHGQDRERHNEPLSIDRFKSNSNYFHGLYLSALNM